MAADLNLLINNNNMRFNEYGQLIRLVNTVLHYTHTTPALHPAFF
jgi:hypothetical protein